MLQPCPELLGHKGNKPVKMKYFLPPPHPDAMLSLPKMTWMPDINIALGGGGGRKYVIFPGLLPLCPKSSGQGCAKPDTAIWLLKVLKSTRINNNTNDTYPVK